MHLDLGAAEEKGPLQFPGQRPRMGHGGEDQECHTLPTYEKTRLMTAERRTDHQFRGGETSTSREPF